MTMTDQTTETTADVVADRAAQVITTMGAEIRTLTAERNRYHAAWHNARDRAASAQADVEFIEQQQQPVDRAEFRDRIAAAIWERQNPGRRYADCEYRWRADAEADAVAVLAVLPEPTNRAAVLLEAADRLAEDAEKGAKDGLTRIYQRAAADTLRRMAAETPPAPQPTPCSDPPCNQDGNGEPCDIHETEQAHAEGEHAFCGVTCEVVFPTEQLRNFVIAKGYPGTAGMLDELLRRAAKEARRG
jgi:hypothetical protein